MVIKVMRIDYVETRSDFEINFKWQADAPRLTQLLDVRLAWSNTETSLCIGLEDKFWIKLKIFPLKTFSLKKKQDLCVYRIMYTQESSIYCYLIC